MSKILQENGDAILKEDGGFLLLEGGAEIRRMGYLQSAIRGFRMIVLSLMGV